MTERGNEKRETAGVVAPAVSFVIPAFNEEKMLPATLGSLGELLANVLPYEVIVVDNGSSDGTLSVAQAHGAVTYVVRGVTVGGLRNYGASRSSAPVLVFLDADVELTEAWVQSIGNTLETLRREPSLITGSVCGVPVDAGWLEKNWFGPWQTSRSSHINSGHLIIARSLFEELGGFDATLQTGEDYEFSRRAHRAGARLANDVKLAVIHNGYPRTLGAFMRREVWHGRSDVESWRSIVASPIAVASVVFLLLHAALIVALALGSFAGAAVSLAALLGICAAASYRQYRHQRWSVVLANTAIYYLYFAARGAAVFKARLGKSSFVHRESR